MGRPVGRPSDYSLELAEEILLRLANGESLNKICKDKHMPERVTVYRWVLRDSEFCNKYRVAREQQADSLVDDTQEIADAATPDDWTVARLRVATRQWAASKLAPRKYGSLQTIDMTVSKAVVKRTSVETEAVRSQAKDQWPQTRLNGNGKAPTTIQ